MTVHPYRTLPIALLTASLPLGGLAVAQPRTPLSSTQARSRIAVLSKAGTPTPRSPVPVRHVAPLNGANLGYNYYYGWGYGYGYGYGYDAYPGRGFSVRSSSSDDTLPTYDTRPGESERRTDSFVNY